VAHNLQGGTSAGFSAHTKLSRKEWGLTWNMGLEASGLVVSDEIRIEVDLELLSSVPEQAAPEVQAPVGVARTTVP
jgi:hypothetical protein